MSEQVVERISKAINGFDARVQAAPDSSWTNQSPCEEWKARDVVAHVVNNLRRVHASIGGPAAAEVTPDEDIRGSWAASRDALLGAVPAADMSATVNGPFGPMPAEQFIGGIITTDVLVHTWDLARAVQGDEVLDADLIAGAYAGLKPLDAMIRRPGVFSDKVESPADADMQTEFLSFLGRKV